MPSCKIPSNLKRGESMTTLTNGYSVEIKGAMGENECEYLGCYSDDAELSDVVVYDDCGNEVESSTACEDCLDGAKDLMIATFDDTEDE